MTVILMSCPSGLKSGVHKLSNFLISLFTCSVTMSLMALLFMALTPLLSQKYCAKWRYYAWLVIVLGLIIPFRPSFDIVPLQVPSAVTQYVPSTDTGVADAGINEANNVLLDKSTGSTNTFQLAWYHIIGCIWLAGVLGVIVYHVLRHRRFMNLVNRWSEDVELEQILHVLQQLQSDMNIAHQVSVKVCPCVTVPMLAGFTKPTILLPTINISSDELPLLLKHELVHYQRKDLWYKAVMLVAIALHWFNPVVYLIARATSIHCEISCDEQVIKNTDLLSRKLYGEAIIGAVRKQSKLQTALSTNFYGGTKGMKNRIFAIMDTTKKKTGLVILCGVLLSTMATGVVFATGGSNPVEQPAAYQSSIPISKQEQAKKRKESIAKSFSIYAEYGLTYDQEQDRFFYNGEMVKFFMDKLDEQDHYRVFTRPDGVMAIKAVRNNQNELTGITTLSQEEYDRLTKPTEKDQKNKLSGAVQQNASAANINGTSAVATERASAVTSHDATSAIEIGDPNYVDDSLNAYLNYGVSYDKNSKVWLFEGKPIHFLSDGENKTYINNSENAIKNGVAIKVIRNSHGKIEQLVKISPTEMKKRATEWPFSACLAPY